MRLHFTETAHIPVGETLRIRLSYGTRTTLPVV